MLSPRRPALVVPSRLHPYRVCEAKQAAEQERGGEGEPERLVRKLPKGDLLKSPTAPHGLSVALSRFE